MSNTSNIWPKGDWTIISTPLVVITVSGVNVSTDPFLQLHNLGNYPDEDRIKNLFVHDTMSAFHPDCVAVANYAYSFLFNTSGAGKTRFLLEGLSSVCDGTRIRA